MEYDVPQLLRQAKDLIDETVTVNGVIFTHWNPERDEDAGVFDDYYLAQDLSSWEDKSHCIFLRHKGLEETLRRQGIRGRVGGINRGGLSNPCRVTGTLHMSTCDLFCFELGSLKTLEVSIEKFGELSRTVTVELL